MLAESQGGLAMDFDQIDKAPEEKVWWSMHERDMLDEIRSSLSGEISLLKTLQVFRRDRR